MDCRAGKLLRKGKFFLVVAEDQPYFARVYGLIRKREIEIGRWSPDDEFEYRRILKGAAIFLGKAKKAPVP